MLKVHNAKTATVISSFFKYQGLRERSIKEGIPFEELLIVEGEVKNKKNKRKSKEADFELKVKGEDGVIQTIVVAEEPAESENTAESNQAPF